MALKRNVLRISMHQRFGDFLLSRAQGEELREEVADALRRGEAVDFDFEYVQSAIASFLNPAYGELYELFPIAMVDAAVSHRNATNAISEMWKLVRQNAVRFYHDPEYRAQLERTADELFS